MENPASNIIFNFTLCRKRNFRGASTNRKLPGTPAGTRHIKKRKEDGRGRGGLGNLPMARGLYGVDVMVNQDLEAKVLEVTFAPDMERFGLFQPEGWNEVFGCLFFNEMKGVTQIV